MRLFDAGARGGAGAERVHDKVWTVANAITFVRLAGLPVFVWLVLGARNPTAGFWTLVAIGTTDWVDGYVARRFDQVTRLGKLLDPLIDRTLLATAAMTLLIAQLMPWWVVALVVGRDVLLLGAGYLWFGGPPPIAVNRMGKFATACLLIGVPAFLIRHLDWAQGVAWMSTTLGIAAYYVAAVQYAQVAWRLRHTENRE